MKSKKVNNWKVATIILGIFAIGLFSIITIKANQVYRIEDKDGNVFEISKDNFERLSEQVNYFQSSRIYDMKHNTSVVFYKMG